MKAIIILNCASEEDIGKKTSIRLTNEENEWVEEVVIKPLPDCPEVPDTIANDVAYIIGWNDCIVEISKERKEAKSLIKNEEESVSNVNGTSIK